LVLGLALFVASGCGGGSGSGSVSPGTTTTRLETTAQTAQVTIATLKGGVRATIRENVKLSTFVLWHNQIPRWATQSTRGPALAALRNAAATRKSQGIQIKNLSGRYAIISIKLAPSYALATALIKSHQRVAPYKAGRRLGRAIVGDDHALIELHRIGNSHRFVVWDVSPT
jgi:hypothetical protein